MFKKLKIKNFQSHENSELEFSPGINIIVPENENDPNDIGKTSIFRALQLLCFNRPMGGSYFPNDKESGKTEISVELSDSKKISLIKEIKKKEVKKTIYKLDKKPFSSIPDQIVSALNLSEVNIQQQLDEPYLVTSSGGEVAKTINRITKIEQSDEWISSLTTEINATNRDITKLKQEIKAKKSELKKYSDIDETVALVNRLERIIGKIGKYTDDYDCLLSVNNEIVEIENWLLFNRKNILSLGKLIDEMEEIFVKIISISKEEEALQYLSDLIEDIEKLKYVDVRKELDALQKMMKEENQLFEEKKTLRELTQIFENVSDLEKVNVEGDLKSVQEMMRKINEMQEEKSELLEVFEIQERTDVLINEYSKIKERYILDLKKFGKCPTCLSIIGDKVIKRIAKEL
jgi:exonuclease SbcC